jgi:hypothetical protein
MNAELHGAFVWDCDECGHENFVRGIESNLDEACARAVSVDLIDVHFDAVAEPDETGYAESRHIITRVVLAPRHVTCRSCGRTFESELLVEGCDEDEGE